MSCNESQVAGFLSQLHPTNVWVVVVVLGASLTVMVVHVVLMAFSHLYVYKYMYREIGNS